MPGCYIDDAKVKSQFSINSMLKSLARIPR